MTNTQIKSAVVELPARPRASVVRFCGYGPSDLLLHSFEAVAEVRFSFDKDDQWSAPVIDVPVIVTANDKPYKSHSIENNALASVLAQKLSEKDPRWSSVPFFEIDKAINDALRYEELPELEAKRYCHSVAHALESFGYLLDMDEETFEEIKQAEESGEGVAALTEYQADLYATVLDRTCANDALSGDFDDFCDAVRTALDAYFLDVQAAKSANGERSVRALVTVGGPYCDIRQFFDEEPEVFYRSGRHTARVALSYRARSVFDQFVEPLFY